MDGYSHHEQEKLVLQVSKTVVTSGELANKEGMGQWKVKGGVNVKLCPCICVIICYLRIRIFCG